MTSSGSSLHVRHIGDAEFSIHMRGHRIVIDLPREAGGEDAGPTPTQLLVASLGAGVALFGRGYLHARGLPDRVNVKADWWSLLTPTRVDRVEISVEAPGLPKDEVDAFRRAIEHCPVNNTLHVPPRVVFRIRAGEQEFQPRTNGRR
jgi:putative redox protein